MVLPEVEVKLFYKLFLSLLTYVNRNLEIVPSIRDFRTAGKLPIERVREVRDALYKSPNLLDRFVDENPEGFSQEELAIVASWRYRVEGEFYIMRYLKQYTVFMSAGKPYHLYGVLGLYSPIEEVLAEAGPLPILVKAVLLPFRDRIIYDGLIESYSILFGGGIRQSLNQIYNRLKQREGIIEQLVGPTGEPQVRTSLDRKAPRKPAPDWRPMIDEIAERVAKMRQTDTLLQGATLKLLRAVVGLAQAAFRQPEEREEYIRRLRQVRSALIRLINFLEEEEEEEI